MKTRFPSHHSRSGSAILIVVALVGLMAAVLVANNKTLHLLNRNLQLIERRQVKRFAAPQATNAPLPEAAPKGPAKDK